MTRMITCKDISGKTYEVAESELRWRPSVYGIVIRDGKLLLSKQFGKYDLPGGGLGLGEKLENGVVREVKEETGLDVVNPRLIGIDDSFFRSSHAEDKSYHSLLVYFVCEYAGGDLSTEGFDEYEKKYAEMAEWIPLEKIDNLEIASTVDYRPHVKRAAALLT